MLKARDAISIVHELDEHIAKNGQHDADDPNRYHRRFAVTNAKLSKTAGGIVRKRRLNHMNDRHCHQKEENGHHHLVLPHVRGRHQPLYTSTRQQRPDDQRER